MSSESKPIVLILAPISPSFQDALESKFHLSKPFESNLPKPELYSQHSNSIRVLLSVPFVKVDSELIGQLPKLECVVALSIGVNHIDMAKCRKRNIKVCNAGQVFSDDVADYVIGLLIDVLRAVSSADRCVRSGKWVANFHFPLGTKMGIRDPSRVVFHLPVEANQQALNENSKGTSFNGEISVSEELLVTLLRLLKKYLSDDSVITVEMTCQTFKGILSTDRGQSAVQHLDFYERSLVEVHSKGASLQVVERLLLDSQKNLCGNLKIADFGLSAFAEPDGLLQTICGTLAYAAPEVVEK